MMGRLLLNRQGIPRRTIQGFTMLEVLGVIAILVVVFALAAPNIVNAQRSMNRLELNAKAEQIYNAVQYRLTALQSAGRLGELEEACETSIPSQEITASAALPDAPGDKKFELYLVGKGDSMGAAKASNERIINDYLLPPDDTLVTQGVTSGDFYIEFSPKTGEVYSVFYWEPSGVKPYATLSAARLSPSDLAELQVGYYSGGMIEGATEGSDSPGGGGGTNPDTPGSSYAGVQNSEELYLRIANNSFASMDPSKLTVTLTIVELDANNNPRDFATTNWETTKWQHTFTGQDSRVQFSANEIDVILDSMYDDSDHPGKVLGFAELLEIYADSYVDEHNESYGARHADITPGSNIRVNLKVEYDGTEVPLYDYDTYASGGTTIQQNSWDVNSAYDSYNMNEGRVELACMRHFNNLRTNLITFDWNEVRYNTIAITNTINFDGTQWPVSSVALSHRGPRETNPNYDLNPLSQGNGALPAIELAEQFKNSGARFVAETDSEGKPYTLRNFVIGEPPVQGASAESNREVRADMYETALFKETGQVSLENIVMENPRVYGGERTGALVAYVKNSGGKLINCKVVGGVVDGTKDVGGLIGYADTIPLDGLSAAVNVSGDENVGGLVGHGHNNVGGENNEGFTNCTVNALKDDESGNLSLVTVSGGKNVGGFIGYMDMGSIVDSYAVCNVEGSSESAGGFVGVALSSASLKRCQVRAVFDTSRGTLVTPTVTSSGNRVGGFAGMLMGWSNAEGCFAAVPVNAADPSSDDALYYGGFVGRTEGTPVITNCYASGPVNAYSCVGGFVGDVDGANGLRSCYTTSNVQAYEACGGFAGRIGSQNWAWENDFAYGEVAMSSGGDDSQFGGFFGVSTVLLQSRITGNNCHYLVMEGYNDDLGNNGAEGQPSGMNFGELAPGGATAAESHPYSDSLQGEAFPFGLVSCRNSANATVYIDHYGDWPEFSAEG